MGKFANKVLALVFSHTTVDETVETILGSVLEHINRLQELGDVYRSGATTHYDIARRQDEIASGLDAKAIEAERAALKLKKAVS